MTVKDLGVKKKSAAVFAELRDAILSGSLKPGSPLPKESELSRRYGIGKTTAGTAVSKLRDEGLVVRIPGKGSFVAQHPLRKVAARVIDFVRFADAVGMHERAADLATIEQLTRTAASQGWSGRWHHLAYGDLDELEALAEQLSESRAVITVKSARVELEQTLHRRGIPVVAIRPVPFNTVPGPAAYPQITFDREATTAMAVDHLVSLGRSRIAFLGRSGGAMAALRFKAFIDSAKRHDLSINANWLLEWRDEILSTTQRELEKVLTSRDRPDAFCCNTEPLAVGVEIAAQHVGLSVPEDIAVVACDTTETAVAEREAPVPVTAVGPSLAQMCLKALKLIESGESLGRCNGDMINPIVVPVELVIRKSCGSNSEFQNV